MSGTNYKRITCAQCGIDFTAKHKRAFCSDKCKWRAKTLARNPDAGLKRSVFHRTCKQCSKEYRYHPAGSDKGHEHERGLFCSSACKTADRIANLPDQFCQVHTGYCLGCGDPFVSRRRKAFCSEACYPVREYVSIAPSTRLCVSCGESFVAPKAKTRPSDFCSSICSAAALAKHRRISRSRRRALTRTVTVEAVDPFKVFDRDKWRCQLCGVKTPKAKRGTYDDDAPEMDHIITLFEGGEHSYRNTQCACRKCNGAKSGRSMGQLLMF